MSSLQTLVELERDVSGNRGKILLAAEKGAYAHRTIFSLASPKEEGAGVRSLIVFQIKSPHPQPSSPLRRREGVGTLCMVRPCGKLPANFGIWLLCEMFGVPPSGGPRKRGIPNQNNPPPDFPLPVEGAGLYFGTELNDASYAVSARPDRRVVCHRLPAS